MSNPDYRHWRLDYDLDRVCWLTIDRAGESTNSLSQEVMTELEDIVTRLEKDHPRGLILQSGKKNSFIVGADIREFELAKSVEEAEGFIRDVHGVFDRIEALPFPTAAVINGYCLGGGLELALCFDFRIAANNDATRLG
ncbi:MAG: enoyl-CoA hydratase-related protein, partial [Xanthomonadales bacterium]|nr:enoyl-CoA hydratase-related protein [Xanthomonadales bacterium]